MSFQECKNLIGDSCLRLPTLGGRSFINISFDINEDAIIIINSGGTRFKIDETHYNMVYNRYNDLTNDNKFVTSQYNDPVWRNCPHQRASPYVAAIVKYYHEQI